MNDNLPFSHKYDAKDSVAVVHHDPSEGFDNTEPASRQITFFVVLSVIALVIVIGALQVYFDGIWDSMVQENVLSVPPSEIQDLRNLEQWRLTHYEYATPSETRVRLPLERARELFLAEAAAGVTFYPALPTLPVDEDEEEAAEAAAAGAEP